MLKQQHKFTRCKKEKMEEKKKKETIPAATPTGFEELLVQRDYGTHDSPGWQQETAKRKEKKKPRNTALPVGSLVKKKKKRK